MTFPVCDLQPAEVPLPMLRALGLQSVRNRLFNREKKILMLAILSTTELASLAPDFPALLRLIIPLRVCWSRLAQATMDTISIRGISGPGVEQTKIQQPESHHTFLAKYWSERLGKSKMRAFQASKRSGFRNVELAESDVLITSHAVIVLEGEISV